MYIGQLNQLPEYKLKFVRDYKIVNLQYKFKLVY